MLSKACRLTFLPFITLETGKKGRVVLCPFSI
jgi:hypothetical protein